MTDLKCWQSRQLVTVSVVMLFVLTLVAAPGYGQATTGQILGTVADTSGGVLPGATVTVTNVDTGQVRSTTSEATGSYAIPLLPPGQYRVDISLDGFKQSRYDAIRIEVGQNQRVDGRLELGSISEQITVTGETVFVDTNSSSVGTVIDRERLEKLPMVGRGVLNLALLTPGVGSATLPQTNVNQRQGPTISASGARPNQSNVMLDGASMRTAAFNTAQSLPSPDSLQEFQVLTSTYPAEYGEAGGATLMAITKSGTNNFSGTAWEYFRNDAMSQKNFFAPSKAKLNQNQFGATFGGPIFQNRTFFFGNYEALRIETQAINRYNVPTAAQRNGDFSGTTGNLNDPLTGQPFPNRQIPVSRFDPMSVNIMNTYLQLPTSGVERVELVDRPTDGNQVTFKIDHRFTDSDTVNVRYYWNKTNGTTANGTINALNYDISNVVQGTAASTTKIYRNNLIGEGRFTYTTITTDQGWSPNNKSPEQLGALWRSSNLPEPAAIVPQVSVTGGGFSLSSGNQNWNERGRLAQVDYKMSWSPTRHAVTFGGSYHWQQNRSYFPFQVGGVIPYNGSFTGNAMADFLLGNTTNFSQYSCFCSQEDQTPVRLYVQDDVKFGRFTLNLGLRYEAGETWVEKNLYASTFRQDQQSTRFPTAPRGLVAPGDAGIPDTIIEADKNNFAPRLGAAWDVRGNGRTSLRAGWGIYYLPMPAQAIEQQNENVPFTQNVVRSLPNNVQSYNAYAGIVQPFPFLYDESAAQRFTLPTQAFNYNPGFETAYMRQYNVNLQQQFGRDLIAMIGYVGSQGRNMLYGREINAAVYGPGATAANAQARRPIDPTSFTSLPSYFSDSTSEFNSLQLTLTKRYSRGYTLQGTYALAYSKDDRSQTSTSASAQSPYDPHDGEWAYSDFDRRNILRVNGVWELPFFNEPSAVGFVLGGWRVAGIASFLSGQPVNVTSGVDRALLGASSRGLGPQRPNQIKDPELPTDRPQDELIAAYFDKTAFVLPAEGSFGNTPRNSIIGPGTVTFDMSLVKRFAMGSAARRALELRIEVFNLLNRVNLNNPNSALNSAQMGQIQSAGDARLMQLGLHFTF